MPVPELFKSSPSVPSPVTPVTVTVYVVPLPLIDAMVPLTVPVSAKLKAPVATPKTASEKVTVNCSVDALFELAPTRSIDETLGGVCSIV